MIPQPPADSLQGVLDAVFAAPKYHWVSRPNPWRWLLEHFLMLVRWFDGLRQSAPLVYWTVMLVAVLVLVAILVHAGWLMLRTIRASAAPDATEAGSRAERRDAEWYRTRGARLAMQGRYAEAMRFMFEATALDLAAAGLVRWHPSKTPREYAREAKVSLESRARLTTMVDGLYAASFEGRAFGPDEYDAWRVAASGGWRGA
ncbi:MAG: DUF4129 domain-containing protein [Gemmatimonadetes bacterium]|nr:DUF4129 domain-containing protein [Gemmatimonadota bacterium]